MIIINEKNNNIWVLYLVLLLAVPHYGFSQENENIQLTKDDIRFISYAPMQKVNDSLRYYYTTMRKEALFEYSKHYLMRGEKQDNDKIRYIANFYLSHCYFYYKSDYNSSLKYADSALKAAKELKDANQIIRGLQLKGSVLDELGKYPHALECFLESVELAQQNAFHISEIRSRVYIGNIKIRLEDYSGGESIYRNILGLLAQQKYKSKYENSGITDEYNRTYASTLNRLGICLRGHGKNALALSTFEEALSFIATHEIYGKEGQEATVHTNLGKTYANLEEYEKAMAYLNRSEKFLLETENKSNVYFQNVFFQAEIQWKLNNAREALEILEKGFDYLSSNEYPPKLLDMYDLAVLLSEKLGNLEKENNYSRRRREVSSAIHENDVATRVLENKELSKENKILSSKNEIIGINLKHTLKLVGILAVLLLTGMIIYLRNTIINKKKFDALVLKIDQSTKTQKEIRSPLKITDEKAKAILEKLKKLEQTHFFINKDCTLHNTAKKLKTNTTYLSKIINGHKSKSFNEYINELRIYYVLEQIKENYKFRNYTIDAIAKELGYKSTNTFTTAFKRYTGLKPSFYIKQVEKTAIRKA